MLNEKDIKPIPKYMLKLIQRRERKTILSKADIPDITLILLNIRKNL